MFGKKPILFRTVCTVLLVVLLLLTISGCGKKEKSIVLKLTDLGIAYENSTKRIPWDLKVYGNKLFVGGGDFDTNESTGCLMCYDLLAGKWMNCGEIKDEQINRFLLTDNVLTIPGMDAVDDWSYGNYYTVDTAGNIAFHRTIKDAVHVFDMVRFEKKLFAATGVDYGHYALSVSLDDGLSFSEVPVFDRDGKLLKSDAEMIRSYDFFCVGNSLFALITVDSRAEIYRYNSGSFYFNSDWSGKFYGSNYTYVPIQDKVVIGDRVYFTSGALCYADGADNLAEIHYIGFDDADFTTDITEHDGKVYVLANRKNEDGSYINRVYRMQPDGTLTAVGEFNYLHPALSIECDGTRFYFGIGLPGTQHDDTGRILSAKMLDDEP